MATHTHTTTRRGAIVGAITAAIGLMAAIGVTALPAGAISPTDTGTVTVSGIEPEATATAYRILDVHYDHAADRPANPQYTWTPGMRDWMTEHYPQYIGEQGTVTDQYADLTPDPVADPGYATEISAFTDAVSGAIAADKVTPAATVTGANSKQPAQDGSVSAQFDLSMGGYVIHATGGAYVYRAVMANVAPAFHDGGWHIDPVTIASKRARPGVDKSVNETVPGHVTGKDVHGTGSDSAGVGERVTFDLRADVPVFPAKAVNKRFVIADAMDPGLDLDAGSIIVSGVAADAKETTLTAGTDYALTVDGAKDLDGNAVTFLIDLSGSRHAKVVGYRRIHVRYSATVNAKAVIGPEGNHNEVVLQYSSNPYAQDDHRTERDDVTVFVYGLRILKTGSDNQPLSGAAFSLLDADGNAMPVIAVDEARGRYRLPEAGETGNPDVPLRVSAEEDSLGRLSIAGLDQGKYSLRETEAPGGYVLNTVPIAFTITDTGKTEDGLGEYTGNVIGQEADAPGYVFGSIANFKGGLPSTGGIGTVALSAVGIMLIAGGLVLAAPHIGRRRA